MIKKLIAIASDHRGYELKQFLINNYSNKKTKFIDYGCKMNEIVDYPDYANKLCISILNQNIIGILICGSGIGMSIAANRHKYIRAALCTNIDMAKLARRHNDANILVLGADLNNFETNVRIFESFISNNFVKQHHVLRIIKLN